MSFKCINGTIKCIITKKPTIYSFGALMGTKSSEKMKSSENQSERSYKFYSK